METVSVSAPSYPDKFRPSSLTLIPMRWVLHANKLPKAAAETFLRRKLLRTNVGRKVRRMLRRAKRDGK